MLVSCSGAHMLVDGGTSADSDVVSSVLRSRGIEVLDYVVCTHAHEDHAGGLAGALNTSKAEVILAPVTEAEQAGLFRVCGPVQTGRESPSPCRSRIRRSGWERRRFRC